MPKTPVLMNTIMRRRSTGESIPVPNQFEPKLWLTSRHIETLFADTAGETPITDTTSVSLWQDLSGNENHASQGTSDNMPTFNADEKNGHGIVSLDGSNDNMLTANTLTDVSAATQIILVRIPDYTLDTNRKAILSSSTSANFITGIRDGGGGSVIDFCINGTSEGTNAQRDNLYSFDNFIVLANRCSQSEDVIETFENGLSLEVDTFNTSISSLRLRIGAPSNCAECDIGEIIFYDKYLTDSQLDQVVEYLRQQWALWTPDSRIASFIPAVQTYAKASGEDYDTLLAKQDIYVKMAGDSDALGYLTSTADLPPHLVGAQTGRNIFNGSAFVNLLVDLDTPSNSTNQSSSGSTFGPEMTFMEAVYNFYNGAKNIYLNKRGDFGANVYEDYLFPDGLLYVNVFQTRHTAAMNTKFTEAFRDGVGFLQIGMHWEIGAGDGALEANALAMKSRELAIFGGAWDIMNNPDFKFVQVAVFTDPTENPFTNTFINGEKQDMADENARVEWCPDPGWPTYYQDDDKHKTSEGQLRTGVLSAAALLGASYIGDGAPFGISGDTLTLTAGTWNTGSITGYVWKRDGVAIDGATSATYETVEADEDTAITCTITDSNANSMTTASIWINAPTPIAPSNIVLSNDEADALESGDTIGAFSADGDTPITWTLDSDPSGYFAILSDGTLKIGDAAEPPDGVYNITAEATNAAGSDSDVFPITVVNSPYSAGSFDPVALGDMLRWYDYADGSTQTTSGSPARISATTNKAGSSATATQATSTRQPKLEAAAKNSNSAMLCDGSNSSPEGMLYPNAGVNGKTNLTVVWVGQIFAATTGDDALIAFGGGSECMPIYINGAKNLLQAYFMGATGSPTTFVNNADLPDDWNIFILTTDGTDVKLWRNGALAYSGAQTGNWTAGAGDYGMMQSNSPNRQCRGYLGEHMIYDKALSDTDREDLEQYLSDKWDITI